MLDVTFRVDVSGAEHELRVISDLLDESAIDDALRTYGEKWLRHRVQERIDNARAPKHQTTGGLGGAKLQRATLGMRKKLHKELKRAKERLHRVEDSAGFDKERERQDFLASKGKRSRHMSEVIRTRQRAVDRRRLVLAEFERLANGGSTDKPLLTAKGSTKLQERMGRAVAGAARKPLGKVASSFKLVVKGGRLVYGSEIKWSAALNDGAVVGHGAVIQPYEFCKLEEIDVEVLVAALMAEGVNVISH